MADFVAEVGDDGLGGWRELPRQSDPVDGAMVIHAGADPRNANCNWLERSAGDSLSLLSISCTTMMSNSATMMSNSAQRQQLSALTAVSWRRILLLATFDLSGPVLPISGRAQMQPTNLVQLVMQFLTPDAINKIADAFGLDRALTQKLITAIVPALLAALTGATAQPGGAQKLADVAKQSSSLDNVSNLIGGGNVAALGDKGSQLLSSLFAGQENTIATALSNFAGVSQGTIKSLLGMAAPVVVGSITKTLGTGGLNANNVAELLSAQTKHVSAALPSGLRDQLNSELGNTLLSGVFREAPTNLIAQVMELFTPDAINKIGDTQGLSSAATQNLISASLPALLRVLGGVAAQPGGAQKLADLAKQSGPLDSLAGMLGSTSKTTALIDKGSQALTSLLGGQGKALTSAVSNFTGTGQSASSSVLAILTPVAMATIAKAKGSGDLSASGIANLFTAQKENMNAALPSGLRAQLSNELGGTHLFDALRDAAGQAAAATGEGDRAAASAARTTLAAGRQAAEATASSGVRAAQAASSAGARAADTAATASLKWLYWAIPLILIAALLWYLFGRPGEQSVQTTANTTPSASTSDAPTTSAGPSVPSLTIGGLDIGKQIDDSLGTLRTSLQGITDGASASAALPKLEQVTTQLDKIGDTLGQATADQRKSIAGWFASLLPNLNQSFDKVLATPSVAGVLKPMIDTLRAKLAALNDQISSGRAAVQTAQTATGSIPSVTIGGLDVGKQINDSLGTLRTSLQGITDRASASAALPKLQQVTTQLDKIGDTLGQATADQRNAITGWFASLLAGLNPLFEKVLGIPDAAVVLKPTIDGLRGKLAALNSTLAASPTNTGSGYSFSAVKDGNSDKLTLSGSLPDQATRQAVLAAAKRMFPTDQIVDNTQVLPGATPQFGKTVSSLLKELSRLGSGSVKIAGTEAEINGSAFSDHSATAIKTDLASLSNSFHVKTDVGISTAASIDAADCQKLFKGLLDKAQIEFETGSATIEPDSTGLLDHLVGVARRCPSASFQVAGYTDSAGNAEFNVALSKRRAETVAKYLTTEGINADRVTAVGYGAADPIASNDTEEGRAKNRRIEIITTKETTTQK
jgi:outer membrane protein OmpA-like peptidoglycan-associated protein